MEDNYSEMQCEARDPDMRSRCGLNMGHVGAHENWHGTWYGMVWINMEVS